VCWNTRAYVVITTGVTCESNPMYTVYCRIEEKNRTSELQHNTKIIVGHGSYNVKRENRS
jgi:hypothetical protein